MQRPSSILAPIKIQMLRKPGHNDFTRHRNLDTSFHSEEENIHSITWVYDAALLRWETQPLTVRPELLSPTPWCTLSFPPDQANKKLKTINPSKIAYTEAPSSAESSSALA